MDITGRIQIRVLTNCQAISTEIGTDSLKIQENFYCINCGKMSEIIFIFVIFNLSVYNL